MRFALIIPVYNHGQTLADVIRQALKLEHPLIVVDDGSSDSTPAVLHNLQGVQCLRHATNRGKGAAIMTGLTAAAQIADWAVTVDADGQHDPRDAFALIAAIPENARPIVVGGRQGMADGHVPWTSRFGRKFSNFWVRMSGGPAVTDSQSGFRIYPLPEALHLNVRARRYQFEVEILVKAHWKKMAVIEAPIGVNYNPKTARISHFRPVDL